MSTPEDALEQARASVASMRAAGTYAEAESHGEPAPGPITSEKLADWALIEPDLRDVRSTRRLGAPITALKRGLLRLMAQYHAELLAEQARFNINLVHYVRALERRLEELERRLERDEARAMNVHQVLSGAGPEDAITTEALAFRSHFREWGWGGTDRAARIAPGLNGAVTALALLRVRPGDVLLFHHSAMVPGVRELLALPNPKLLLYHNVTPASWLWDYAPLMAVQCAIGREQLREILAAVDLAAADSEFNAAELRALGAPATEVIPLLIERGRLGGPVGSSSWGPALGAGPARPPSVLFVGRLSPHKRQDDVIRAFALYRRHRAPDARLALVGDPITSAYLDHLRRLADRLAPGAVTIESAISEHALARRYREADAFLCLSAHEGFCIPLLEAFHFGVPVIARPKGAVPETAGDAALLVGDDDLAVVAELLHLVISEPSLRAELRRRGQARLLAYEPATVAGRLRTVVQATVSAVRSRSQPLEVAVAR